MLNKLFLGAATLALINPAMAQTGEDHRAKSDVTNRAGSNGSTGATSRDPSTGADPNVGAGTSLATSAVAPHGNEGNIRTDRAARARVKKIQAEQRSANGSRAQRRSQAHD